MSSHSPTSTPEQGKPFVGVLWMLFAGLMFVAVTAIVKYIGPSLPAAQSAFMRYLLGLVFLIPMIKPLIRARLDRRDWWLFSIRGSAHSLAVLLWFFAMARIPLADVTAMNYLSPIFVTLGAALVIGEKLALRRVMAVLCGLIGAMIILRPGIREVSSGHLAILTATMFFGISYVTAKMATEKFSPAVIVGLLSITVTIGLAPMAWVVWIPPTTEQVVLMFAVAFVATIGHYAMTLGFAAAPVTVTQPTTFLQLVWAVLLGTFVFGESIDIWVLVGGAIIIGSVSFITWREAVLKRKVVAPPHLATKV